MKIVKFSIYNTLILLLFFSTISSRNIQPPSDQNEWVLLFNGKNLDGWESYLGPRYNEQAGNFAGERMGLNNDPDRVFTVVEENGENVIRISGEHFGCIATKEEFENYHLQLQFKWGEKKYVPRKKAKRDSGLLYHSHGPHGVGWFFWMASQEFQVQEGDCGDYWSVLSDVDANVVMNADSTYTYNKNGVSKFFGPHGGLRGHIIKSGDAEKSNGEWNTLDLYTFGGSSIHEVNGKIVMVLHNSRQIVNGELVPLTKGKIQLQSEGAEIFFKNIKIEKIAALPAVEK
jgi:hypothetical protein